MDSNYLCIFTLIFKFERTLEKALIRVFYSFLGNRSRV